MANLYLNPFSVTTDQNYPLLEFVKKSVQIEKCEIFAHAIHVVNMCVLHKAKKRTMLAKYSGTAT